VIPQRGHAPFEEQPDVFLAARDEFLTLRARA
jgi:pimeloyl-ACP methyl ester carboxylesterase